MAIKKMNLMRVTLLQDDIENVLSTMVQSKDFHPELAINIANEGNQGIPLVEDTRYEAYLDRLLAASQTIKCDLTDVAVDRDFTDEQIEEILENVETQIAELNQEMQYLSSVQGQDIIALKKLKEYDIEALNSLDYVSVHVGRFPESSIQKLALHNQEHFIYDVLNKNNHYFWIIYICLKDEEENINAMFKSLFFEPIPLPHIDEDEIAESCSVDMVHIYGFLKHKAEINKLRKYLIVFDEHLVLSGFIPAEKTSEFKHSFSELPAVKVQEFPADAEEGLVPPTVLKNGWMFRPFEMFVEMYGLPKYGTFDPTNFVGITYCILFGLMFGDLGQGFALLFIGLYMEKKMHLRLGGIITRLAPFSMFFGLCYGSVFGEEHLLDPMFKALGFHEKPIHVMDPGFVNTLLLSAIGIGVVLILTCIGINIISNIKHKKYGKALFDQNGLAGFILYSSVVIGIAFPSIPVLTPVGIVVCIVIPVLLILFKEPFAHLIEKVSVSPHGGWGNYLTESIFELLEVALSFISNTMSYLRVGGFVLSHAGMMLVVMTIKGLTGDMGLLVLIFGNIFVMALEGLIVGIQTLRLEYYEMFSRYYEGGGKKFQPISLEKTH